MTQRDRTDVLSRRHALAGLAAAVAAGPIAAAAETILADSMVDAADMRPGQFVWYDDRAPEGAVAVIVSLPLQRVFVYRNGVRIAVATCSTGKPGHATPTGVFTILQKDKHHHSSTYNNAPMPNMNRLTWSGIAIHAGHLPGYPASHGCVRVPMGFSEKLFQITHLGTPVIVAGANSPWEVAHPGLLLGAPGGEKVAAAVSGLPAKARPSDWTAGTPVTSVLLTGEDRRATLIRDGEVMMQEPLSIEGPPRLGEHVLMLRGLAPTVADLVWDGVTYAPDPGGDPAAPEPKILGRLKTPRDFRDAALELAHPGMSLIISDLPATPDSRSDTDFVIMTADVATSPVPPPRGEAPG